MEVQLGILISFTNTERKPFKLSQYGENAGTAFENRWSKDPSLKINIYFWMMEI